MTTQADAKLAVLESRQDRTDRVLEGIANSLAILARVEIQNATLTATVAALTTTVREQGETITAIKEEMPSLKLVRFGAGALVIGILAAVGTAMLKLVGLGAA